MLFQIIAIFTTDAPFVPVPNGVENEIVENLELTSESILYDLGCGDGRVLIAAVKKFPNITAVGVEKGLFPYYIAKWKTRKFQNIKIKREDIFKTDFSDATHVFTYLYPEVINRLTIPEGILFASADFKLNNIPPAKVIELHSNSKRGRKLFLYESAGL